MKNKFKKVILGIFLIGIGVFNFQKNLNNNTVYTDLLNNNIEALASGEVIVEALCQVTNDDICIVYSDGYFLKGINRL